MNMQFKGKLTLIFILLNLSFVCRSQETEWLRINPLPFESTIESATIIPGTDKIVAVGDYATLMSSVNNGEDWTLQRRPAGIPYSSVLKSVHFPSQTHGYILGNNSLLLKSTDSGVSWEDISLEGNYNHQEVYFNDNEVGFITGERDIFCGQEMAGLPGIQLRHPPELQQDLFILSMIPLDLWVIPLKTFIF